MRSILKHLLEIIRPQSDPVQRLAFIKAFQKFWVTGTLGAYFAALAKNVPTSLAQTAWPPDVDYSLEVALKYAYLAWFLSYFFASSMYNDHPHAGRARCDVMFDVIQSASAFVAAYFLGLIGPTRNWGHIPYHITNSALLAICGLSWGFFHKGARDGVNLLRILGAVFALLALLFSFAEPPQDRYFLIGLLVIQILMLLVLAGYLWICYNVPPKPSTTVELATAAFRALEEALRASTAAEEVSKMALQAAKAAKNAVTASDSASRLDQ